MIDKRVVFLEHPQVGKPVKFLINGAQGRTSRVVHVLNVPTQDGMFCVTTASGSKYSGFYSSTRANTESERETDYRADKINRLRTAIENICGRHSNLCLSSIDDTTESLLINLFSHAVADGMATKEAEQDRNYELLLSAVKEIVIAALDSADFVSSLVISTYYTGRKPTGHPITQCCLSVSIDRGTYLTLFPAGLNPHEFLSHFPMRSGIKPRHAVSAVTPHNLASSQEQSVKELSPIGFENQVAQLLEYMGFQVSQTKETNDGGIDIIAINPAPIVGGKLVIQCKRYREGHNVGEPMIRDLWGVVDHERASKGILITTSGFTNSARRFAEGKPIELIDGKCLIELLSKYQQHVR